MTAPRPLPAWSTPQLEPTAVLGRASRGSPAPRPEDLEAERARLAALAERLVVLVRGRAREHAGVAHTTIAEAWCGLDPGTPEHATMLELLARTTTPEYQHAVDMYFILFALRCAIDRRRGSWRLMPEDTDEGILDALDDWRYSATLYDFRIDESVSEPDPTFREWKMVPGKNHDWPTGTWIRWAQTEWEASTWRIVPSLPCRMLAWAGYKLAGTGRDLSGLSAAESKRLLEVLGRPRPKHGESDTDFARRTDEHMGERASLLSRCPMGMWLPILDVDESKPKGELTDEQRREGREACRTQSISDATGVTEAWKEILGTAPVWLVTNIHGGLHGRTRCLPPTLRHGHLTLALEGQLRALGERHGYSWKGMGGKSAGGVAKEAPHGFRTDLDLAPYHKTPSSRGGVWRLPACRKDKPGSLPQTPVMRHAAEMPHLARLDPASEPLSGARVTGPAVRRVLGLCAEHLRSLEAKEARHTVLVEDRRTGKRRRVQRESRIDPPDLGVGTAALPKTAEAIRRWLPEHLAGHDRHAYRMGLIGWMLKTGVPTEAVRSTMLASGGNQLDVSRLMTTTIEMLRSGRRKVLAMSGVTTTAGEDAAREIERALSDDIADRKGSGTEPAESPETALIAEIQESEVVVEEPAGPDGGGPDGGPDPGGGATKNGLPLYATENLKFPKRPKKPDKEELPEVGERAKPRWPARSIPTNNPLAMDVRGLQAPAIKADHKAGRLFLTTGGRPMERTAARIMALSDRLPAAERKYLAHVIGDYFAWGCIHRDVLEATIKGAGMQGALTAHREASGRIRNWREGHDPPPKLSRWASLNKKARMTWDQIRRLQDAIDQDLEEAGSPVEVRKRVLPEDEWTCHDRQLLQDIYEMRHAIMAAGHEIDEDTEKLIFAASMCRSQYLRRDCECHGEISRTSIRCGMEMVCPGCRASYYMYMTEHMVNRWPSKLVAFLVPYSQGPVTRPAYDKPADGGKKSKASEKKGGGKKRRGRRKGRKVSREMEDRLKHHLRNDPDWRAVKKWATKIGFAMRAFPTLDGMLVFMPAYFVIPHEITSKDFAAVSHFGVPNGRPVETLRMLREGVGGTSATRRRNLFASHKPQMIWVAQAVEMLVRARNELCETVLDRPLIEIGREARAAGRDWTDMAAYRDVLRRRGHEILSSQWLRLGFMRPVISGNVKRILPWFTTAARRAAEKAKAEEANGGHDASRCPVYVASPSGASRERCDRTLWCTLHDLNTDAIIAQNSMGEPYPREGGWKRAWMLGLRGAERNRKSDHVRGRRTQAA